MRTGTVMGGCILPPHSREQVINGMTQARSDGDPVNKMSSTAPMLTGKNGDSGFIPNNSNAILLRTAFSLSCSRETFINIHLLLLIYVYIIL